MKNRIHCCIVYYVFIQLIAVGFASKSDFKCSKNFASYRCRLNTRTPYRFVANNNETEIKFKGCTAKKIWFMIRHGARLPEPNILSETKNLQLLRDQILTKCNLSKCNLSTVQINRLKNWKTQFTEASQPRMLVKEGEQELFGLGQRYQSRFPNLMPKKFTNQTIKLKFTNKQRTAESARYFTIGLSGNNSFQKVWLPKPVSKDAVLQFSSTCDSWLDWVNNNRTASEQYEMFESSTVVRKMLDDLSARLGVKVTLETARLIYDVCSYETAWNKTKSAWCLLKSSDYKIFEFIKDLKTYWTDGYGYPLNYEQACPVLVDMFTFFTDERQEYKISAYFSHTSNILKTFALLNIIKGCDTGPGIIVQHQERILNLPGCPKNTPCPLDTMKNNYPLVPENCNFQKMCALANPSHE
ncbi:multiple inositol polyphosphate phosphatase 1-like isoform X2 [Aphidius gifuensis]|uniref:multiple inositol polyphosphate phosphatase 1-like isoform X2 n=1 Tax=Aphidius gifuensis TaxID=684658 RepID=UPI001CDBF713|nr:multiple inositol polyphosphate phosphatase 1-like isoform X2 [Aphidius gifuensis]